MSLFTIHKTFENFKRAQEIITILIKHGFGHFIGRLNLPEKVPGITKLKVAIKENTYSSDKPTPEKLVNLLIELGPTFIKFGQLLSTRPDIVPAEYIDALALLQDKVAPFPSEEAVEIIEKEFSKTYLEIFPTFDLNPIASGSLGQVHYATITDGTEVVVKIKRPGADKHIKEDINLMLWFADQIEKHIPEAARFRPRKLCEEFARTVRSELDFVSEGAYTDKFSQDTESDKYISTPKVYWDYVSKDILVLERINGKSLADANLIALPDETRRNLANAIGNSFLRQFFITGLFHADPHPGNFILGDNKRLYLVDFGQMGYISQQLKHQLSFGLTAISYGDFDMIGEIYADIGGLNEDSDLKGFKGALHTLLNRYYGVPIEKIDFPQAFEEIVTISRENNIYLQRELVVFGKSLATAIGLAQRLDPGFRFDEIVKPFIREIVSENIKAKNLMKTSVFSLYSIMNMIRRTPRDIFEILQKAKAGKFKIIFHHEALENLGHRLDMASNRLSLSLVISAIIVGSSMVLSNSQQLGDRALPLVGKTPVAYVLATLGFGAAIILGFGLIWGIIKSSRNKSKDE